MKRAKNIFYSALVFVMLVNFSGCGDKNKSAPQANGTVELPSTEIAEDSTVYAPTEEILGAKIESGMLQIGNTVITMPAKVSDFLAAGCEFADDKYSEDYIVLAHESTSRQFQNTLRLKLGTSSFSLIAFNDSDDKCPLSEAVVKYFEFLYHPENEFTENVFLPGGLSFDSSLDEVEEKLGKTESLSYEFTNTNLNISIKIAKETGKIEHIEIKDVEAVS
jgi:hypothetical protein